MTSTPLSRADARYPKPGKPHRPGWNPWNRRQRAAPTTQNENDWAAQYYRLGLGPSADLPADFERWQPMIAYVRVSSDEQADHYGPDAQRRLISTYCRAHALRVVDEFFDDDSGKLPLSIRPEGAALLKALLLNKGQGVICAWLDRLARNSADAQTSRRQFMFAGIAMHFTDIGLQDDTTSSRLLFGIKANLAEIESDMIRDRTMNGRREKAESGGLVLHAVPYGYRKLGMRKDASMEPEPEHAAVVRSIFTWYVMGPDDEAPLSAIKIAKRLTELGVPRPGARLAGDPNDCHWDTTAILRILRQTDYYGIHTHGKEQILPALYDGQPISQRRGARPVAERISITLPEDCRLIPQSLYDAAQDKLAQTRNWRNLGREHHRLYLLSGFVFCETCGRRMHGNAFTKTDRTNPKSYTYYTCGDDLKACPARRRAVNASFLEPEVIAIIRSELDEPRLSSNIEALRARRADTAQGQQQRVGELRALIAEEKRSIDQLVARLDKAHNTDVIESIERRLEERGTAIEQYRAALATAEARLEIIDLTPERERELRQLALAITERLTVNPTIEQLRALFEMVHLEVYLDCRQKPYDVRVVWALGEESTFQLTRGLSGTVDSTSRSVPCGLRMLFAVKTQIGCRSAVRETTVGLKRWEARLAV